MTILQDTIAAIGQKVASLKAELLDVQSAKQASSDAGANQLRQELVNKLEQGISQLEKQEQFKRDRLSFYEKMEAPTDAANEVYADELD